MSKMNKTVFNKRFDIRGNELSRLFKLSVLSRLIPIGNIGGGAGFRCLFVMSLLHYLGRPAFYVLTRYERYFHYLFRQLARLRGRM